MFAPNEVLCTWAWPQTHGDSSGDRTHISSLRGLLPVQLEDGTILFNAIAPNTRVVKWIACCVSRPHYKLGNLFFGVIAPTRPIIKSVVASIEQKMSFNWIVYYFTCETRCQDLCKEIAIPRHPIGFVGKSAVNEINNLLFHNNSSIWKGCGSGNLLAAICLLYPLATYLCFRWSCQPPSASSQ